MAKRIDSLQVAAVNTSQPSTVWMQNEESQEEQQQEQVQYMHNQNSGQNEVYGETYNPSWKNHPNLRWGDNHNQGQQSWQRNTTQNIPRNNQQNNNQNSFRKPQNTYPNSNYYPTHNQSINQNTYHQPPTSHNQPQAPPESQRITNLETLIDKLWKHQEMTAKNQEASIKNMERQIGQLSKHFATERPSSSLPSDTIPNPKEECKAIQLRSGRTLVSNNDTTRKQVESSKKPTNAEEANDQDMVPNKNTENPKGEEDQPINTHKKEEEAIQGQQKKKKNLIPPLPYPQRFNKETKDQHFRKFLETFKKGVIENLLVKVDKFIYPADFVVLDSDMDESDSIILGRPFLATARAIIDVEQGELTLRMHEESIILKVFPEPQFSKEGSKVVSDCCPRQATDNTGEQKNEHVKQGLEEGYKKLKNTLE
ncbi:uncharacterized protein LOC130960020 [Arachis stenosperma]|uniref:uncharacterized protein LOC130960020 n=1 Tax=Arachis stenosperma TaxID=217475 RepID=UPI0025AC5494|nr:uncharacterized protein LOC130960020 [Arachis stenosperma]